MTEISKAPIARLLSQAGGDRISAEAVDEMVKYTEDYVLKVAPRPASSASTRAARPSRRTISSSPSSGSGCKQYHITTILIIIIIKNALDSFKPERYIFKGKCQTSKSDNGVHSNGQIKSQ